MTKDQPGGYYIVLKRSSTLTRDRMIIDIGYKYNLRKVLSFIATEDRGSTKYDIPSLSKYHDPFSNVAISHVACPLVMYR